MKVLYIDGLSGPDEIKSELIKLSQTYPKLTCLHKRMRKKHYSNRIAMLKVAGGMLLAMLQSELVSKD